MTLHQKLLALLSCPQCKGGVTLVEGGRGLLCEQCQLKYPVREDIPVLIVREAIDLKRHTKHGLLDELPELTFRIVEGPDRGMSFSLSRGSCKAIGRAETDPNKTTMFSVELSLALDEGTKSLIMRYVEKQFQKHFDGFRRASDLVLSDGRLSRLHAMIFSDEGGLVGILDLVSKNGTFVNGQEVESRLLKKGDAIEIGETKIVFEE